MKATQIRNTVLRTVTYELEDAEPIDNHCGDVAYQPDVCQMTFKDGRLVVVEAWGGRGKANAAYEGAQYSAWRPNDDMPAWVRELADRPDPYVSIGRGDAADEAFQEALGRLP